MVYGKYEYMEVDIHQLIALPQVRKEKNAKIDELVQSISQNGLINPIDIVIMNMEQFKRHIDFINGLWHLTIDFKAYPSIENQYYVIVAGHTRYQAICQIEKEQNQNSKISVKIHQAKTSEDILSLQLDENIHKEPRIEERAIAIIEYYNLGLQTGKWSTKNDFIKENQHKFSRTILNDALAFSNNPPEIQSYILNGNAYYQVGVELGKIANLIIEHEKYQLDGNYTEEQLKRAIWYRYAIILSQIQKKKSVKKAIDYIQNYKRSLEDAFREKEELRQELLSWFQEGTDRQNLEYLKNQRQQMLTLKQELSSQQIHNMSEFLSLVTELTDVDTEMEQKVLQKISSSYQEFMVHQKH